METDETITLKRQLKITHLVHYPIIYQEKARFWSNINEIFTQDYKLNLKIVSFFIGSKDIGDESWRITLDNDSDYKFYKNYFSINIDDESMRFINRYRFFVFYVTFRKASAGWMIDIPYEYILWVGYS